MKNTTLASLGCAAVLCFGGACTNEPSSKKEGGSLPKPYIETLPTINEVASNIEGGVILGKKPNEVEVSPTVNLNSKNNLPIDLQSLSLAGVSMSNTVQAIIDSLGVPRIVEVSESTYYIFDDVGVLVGVQKETAGGLNATPDFLYTSIDFGYKGVILAPSNLGEIKIGKSLMNGTLNNLVAVENFTRDLGAFANNQDPSIYDCFMQATCAAIARDDGGFSIVMPQTLVNLSPDGAIENIEMGKTIRQLENFPASTMVAQYGISVGGLSYDASLKTFKRYFGDPVVNERILSYQNETIATTRNSKGQLQLIALNNGFQGLLLAATGQPSEIQFGSVISGNFDCENLAAVAAKSFDSTQSPSTLDCKVDGDYIRVDMPGAGLTFIKDSKTAKVTLNTFELYLRPIIYGDSFAGLYKDMTLTQVLQIYPYLYNEVSLSKEETVVNAAPGLQIVFTSVKDTYIVKRLIATAEYRALIYGTDGKLVGKLGSTLTFLNFSSEIATTDTFLAFASKLESAYLTAVAELAVADATTSGAAIPQSTLNPAPAAPVLFDSENECSFARIKTPTCYLESKTSEGLTKYSVSLPRLSFEFDSEITLSRVSL